MTAEAYPPGLAEGSTAVRVRRLTTAARGLHRAILRWFAATGHAPDRAALSGVAPQGELDSLLAELHDLDVVRVDEAGGIRAAYPFSGAPTSHRVVIDGGPSVYAMCAIDALGVAAMLGRGVAIASTDPASGAPLRVAVRNGQATWQPDTAVVFVGSDTAVTSPAACCPPPTENQLCTGPSADRCCTVMSFFTGPATAQAWIAEHPHVTGVVLTQPQAVRLGVDIFGDLLDD